MAGKQKTTIKRKRWTKNDTELTILALPTAVWYVVFSYLPMFGIIIAFKNYKLSPGHGFIYSLFHSKWCGFDNFKFFIQSNANRLEDKKEAAQLISKAVRDIALIICLPGETKQPT